MLSLAEAIILLRNPQSLSYHYDSRAIQRIHKALFVYYWQCEKRCICRFMRLGFQ